MARRFRLNPEVVLHGIGGLCYHERAASDRDDALVVAAGPAASLLLGGVTWVVFQVLAAVDPSLITRPLATLYAYMIWVNVVWGLLNLVPLWPLDGGQLFRLGLIQRLRPGLAERVTHITGLVVGVSLFLYALSLQMTFAAVLVAFLSYQNLTALQSTSASGPIRTKSKQGKALLAQANAALSAGDLARASQLAHQVRTLTSTDKDQMEQVWRVLAITTTAEGDYARALRYAERAKPTPDVVAAHITCLARLDRAAEARALAARHRTAHLPEDVQAALDTRAP
jgi:hypothetical protein